jgi:diguanylate cyclase (GGDEF)-like protein
VADSHQKPEVRVGPARSEAARAERRSAEVWLLTAMTAVATLRGLLTAVAPPSPQTPVAVFLVVSCLAACLGLMVWFLPWRWCRHLTVMTGVVAVALVVSLAATGAGAIGASIGYVWLTLYAAFFFSRRAARAYAAAAVVAFAGAVTLNPFPGAVAVGVPLVLTIVLVSEATSRVLLALRKAATTDALTGLLNRHGLFAVVQPSFAQAMRTGRPLTVVVLDLDGFKLVNDREGHAAGDRVLVELATAWKPLLRVSDVVARIGGDEFVMVLPDTDAPAAREMMHRLHHLSPIAWSFGLATAQAGRTFENLLADADADLYRAKLTRSALPQPRASRNWTEVLDSGHPAMPR